MRYLPENDADRAELSRLNAEPWMIEHLKLNPAYALWGPGSDCMSKSEGVEVPREFSSWSAFGPCELDDYTECVHFYFELERPKKACLACNQSGYNPETKVLADTFYDFEGTGQRWRDKITQDEVDALVEAGRLRKWSESCWQSVPRTAMEVNAANARGAKCDDELTHDGYNCAILIKTRARRLGVWGLCPACEGHSTVFTAPRGHLNVVLWLLHPREGASRGILIRGLSREDAGAARRWLVQAAERNAKRFEKVALFDSLHEALP